MTQESYLPNSLFELLGMDPTPVRRERVRKNKSKVALFPLFVVIGAILLFCCNYLRIEVVTLRPKETLVGKGIFIQTYEECSPRVKLVFNKPGFVSKTERGYLIKIPVIKTDLELITSRPKITMAGENIFIQNLELCPPKVKLLFP